MRSIRSYLLSRLVGGAALVLTLASGVLYAVVTHALESEFDRNLIDSVQGMASILFQTEDEVHFEFSEQIMPQYEPGPRAAYFELWFADGSLLERSNSLEGGDLVLSGAPGREPTHWRAPLPDGRDGRYVAQLIEVHHVYPEEGPDRPQARSVLVVLAEGRQDLVSAQRRVLLACALSLLALMALISASSWRAVKRGLEPAERLAAKLDAIQVDDLPAHFEVGELPAELAPVARKTDQLIRRVEVALERERRTTADIAHELRTPLSELLTVAEVALRNGQDPADTQRALATVRGVAARMGRSVATLLELAHMETGAFEPRIESVDLGALVEELSRSLAREARARGLTFASSIALGVQVDGQREVLRIVLSNLLGNAVHYADRDSTVTCDLEHPSTAWSLSVTNRTSELQSADLRSLAEPFWRKDRARSDRDHSGLGLALSRALAERAGLRLKFELEHDSLRATLSLG